MIKCGCGCNCGLRKMCGVKGCQCECHAFDHMHSWQVVALCKNVSSKFDVEQVAGKTRNELFAHIRTAMSEKALDRLLKTASYDGAYLGQVESKCNNVPTNIKEFLSSNVTLKRKIKKGKKAVKKAKTSETSA